MAVHARLKEFIPEQWPDVDFSKVEDADFKRSKKQVLICKQFFQKYKSTLNDDDRHVFYDRVCSATAKQRGEASSFLGAFAKFGQAFVDAFVGGDSAFPDAFREAETVALQVSDVDYVTGLNELVEEEPFLRLPAYKSLDRLHDVMRAKLKGMVNKVAHKAKHAIQEDFDKNLRRESTIHFYEERRLSRQQLLSECDAEELSLHSEDRMR